MTSVNKYYLFTIFFMSLFYLVGALDPYKHKMHRGEVDYLPQAPTLIPMPDKNLTEDSDLTSSEMLVNMSSSTLEEYYLGN